MTWSLQGHRQDTNSKSLIVMCVTQFFLFSTNISINKTVNQFIAFCRLSEGKKEHPCICQKTWIERYIYRLRDEKNIMSKIVYCQKLNIYDIIWQLQHFLTGNLCSVFDTFQQQSWKGWTLCFWDQLDDYCRSSTLGTFTKYR